MSMRRARIKAVPNLGASRPQGPSGGAKRPPSTAAAAHLKGTTNQRSPKPTNHLPSPSSDRLKKDPVTTKPTNSLLLAKPSAGQTAIDPAGPPVTPTDPAGPSAKSTGTPVPPAISTGTPATTTTAHADVLATSTTTGTVLADKMVSSKSLALCHQNSSDGRSKSNNNTEKPKQEKVTAIPKPTQIATGTIANGQIDDGGLETQPYDSSSHAQPSQPLLNGPTERLQSAVSVGPDANQVASKPLVRRTKLSTGHFVNGKYLASSNIQKTNTPSGPTSSSAAGSERSAPGSKSSASSASAAQSPQTPTGNKPKTTMRRFLGQKNKFRPNLLPRAQQIEESLRRQEGSPTTMARDELPVNRQRKTSSGDKTARQGERKRSAAGDLVSLTAGVDSPGRERKLSTGDETGSGKKKRHMSCGDKQVAANNHTTRPRTRSFSESPTTAGTKAESVRCLRPRTLSNGGGETEDLGTAAVVTRTRHSSAPGNKAAAGQLPRPCISSQTTHTTSTQKVTPPVSRKRRHSVSEDDDVIGGVRLKPPPAVKRSAVVSEGGAVSTPLIDQAQQSDSSKQRIRPLHDRDVSQNTHPPYDPRRTKWRKQKMESRGRFRQGVPGRDKMKMFDLIYYNPNNGTNMARDDEEEDGQLKNPKEEAEENADDPTSSPPPPARAAPAPRVLSDADDPAVAAEEDSNLPVPQVKVGPNGEIILDESSTLLETTAAKKAKEDLTNSPVVIENSSRLTNYGTWSKKRRYNDWGERETFKFYRALSMVGSDFSMMESIFKKRSRKELKLKFKKEEKNNAALIDLCLKQCGQFEDLEELMGEDTEDEEEEEDRPKRGRPKKAKGRRRKKYSSRGNYENWSSEDADVSETSRSPARTKPTQPIQKATRRLSSSSARMSLPAAQRAETSGPSAAAGARTSAPTALPVAAAMATKPGGSNSGQQSGLTKIPGVQFPPALLAANPGLAGAKPGSLVVVASPSKPVNGQYLHFYMVSDKNKKVGGNSAAGGGGAKQPAQTGLSSSSGTPPHARPNTDQPARLSMDPAVVRAVDRKRSSADTTRTISSMSPSSTSERRFASLLEARQASCEPDSPTVFRRQRTLSEGNVISPSRLTSFSQANNTNQPRCDTEPRVSTDNAVAATSGLPQIGAREVVKPRVATVSSIQPPDSTALGGEGKNLPIARKSKPS